MYLAFLRQAVAIWRENTFLCYLWGLRWESISLESVAFIPRLHAVKAAPLSVVAAGCAGGRLQGRVTHCITITLSFYFCASALKSRTVVNFIAVIQSSQMRKNYLFLALLHNVHWTLSSINLSSRLTYSFEKVAIKGDGDSNTKQLIPMEKNL